MSTDAGRWKFTIFLLYLCIFQKINLFFNKPVIQNKGLQMVVVVLTTDDCLLKKVILYTIYIFIIVVINIRFVGTPVDGGLSA